MSISPLLDRRGGITHFIAIKLDISDRKRSEVQRYMLAQAVESSSELVAMTDPDLRITFANRALIHALGYSKEKELIGKNIAAIMSPNNAPELFPEIAKGTMEGGVWRGECLHLRADGTDYPISLSTNIVKDSAGRNLGTLGIAQDITARKQFPAKNSDIEVLRFVLVAHGEEVSCKEAFVCNRRVRRIHALPPVVDKLGCSRKRPRSKGGVSSAGYPITGS